MERSCVEKIRKELNQRNNMPRPTQTTKKEKEFMQLRDYVLDTVKTPKDWKEFKSYMDAYYAKKKRSNRKPYPDGDFGSW